MAMRYYVRLVGFSFVAQGQLGGLVVDPGTTFRFGGRTYDAEHPYHLASLDAAMPRIANAITTDWISIPTASEPHFRNLEGYRAEIKIHGWIVGRGEARVEINLWNRTGASVGGFSRNATCYGGNIGNLGIECSLVKGRTREEVVRRAFRDQFRRDPGYSR
ncbi:hypothetical protein [Roseospira navarrensis]|uniref:Uncharacterized protein n=1 Tax=Roseospira navarrensis TaxID=140058 RepID=A0A7X1ZAY6_9PROT|nr:hypothetical protein [Roseospira navarrensis]MQX35073.1 hypothetical protein [Roseospira navarrensis]